MAHLLQRGRPYVVQPGVTEAVLVGSINRGGQIGVRGTTFNTATLSVAGRGTMQGSGANGQITQSDVESFAEWDQINLTEIVGHTAVLDADVVFDAIKVGGLVEGNTVVIY